MIDGRYDATAKDFFLDIWENDDFLETDNEAEALAAFYACQYGCLLWRKGKIYGEKDFVFDDVNDFETNTIAELTEDHIDAEPQYVSL